uniref:SH2 domain-containing protein n=1 Tax=Takifugu rubripes TaxID=31033 RepID=A0A3B5KHB6_TAKRU
NQTACGCSLPSCIRIHRTFCKSYFPFLSRKPLSLLKPPRCRLGWEMTAGCFHWLFDSQGQKKMEQREALMESQAEGSEGKLRELTTRWFIDTQLPLIVDDGFFPKWFLGFITRKDAEEILREKELGCFLIRLSDKAIAYILSYKGRDRCRHFVINQSQSGQFLVCGDSTGHGTLSELIEYYRTTPIEPFGEHLTSSCTEMSSEELYDIIQVKEKPLVTARAVRNVQNVQYQQNSASEPLPTRLPKSNRAPTEAPPVPRRSRQIDSSFLNDQDRLLYAQLSNQSSRERQRLHPSQDSPTGQHQGTSDPSRTQHQNIRRLSPLLPPASIYTELGMDGRSRSLPLLDSSWDREQSHRLSAPSHTPPRHSPRSDRQSTAAVCSASSSGFSLEEASNAAVYHLAGSPRLCETRLQGQEDAVYTEVPSELITGRNTYESVEDLRTRQKQASWGLKNDKWKWPFPEVKRK